MTFSQEAWLIGLFLLWLGIGKSSKERLWADLLSKTTMTYLTNKTIFSCRQLCMQQYHLHQKPPATWKYSPRSQIRCVNYFFVQGPNQLSMSYILVRSADQRSTPEEKSLHCINCQPVWSTSVFALVQTLHCCVMFPWRLTEKKVCATLFLFHCWEIKVNNGDTCSCTCVTCCAGLICLCCILNRHKSL